VPINPDPSRGEKFEPESGFGFFVNTSKQYGIKIQYGALWALDSDTGFNIGIRINAEFNPKKKDAAFGSGSKHCKFFSFPSILRVRIFEPRHGYSF
jgi:hypothetical protein